jgi:hypothetical protein
VSTFSCDRSTALTACAIVRRCSRRRAIVAAIGLALLGAGDASAQVLQRVGGEFQVNRYTALFQSYPSISADADGDFVVVWSSIYQDGVGGYGIFGRRFDSHGVSLGTEFQVNVRTADSQARPSVSREVDGDFVVVWESFQQDGDGYGIFGRRFNATGTPVGGEFLVNSFTASNQRYPAVAVSPDGRFVVSWQTFVDGGLLSVGARRFGSTGAAIGGEFRVNTYTPGNQFNPAVTAASNGSFTIAWESTGQDGEGNGVFAKRFDSAGVALAGEFQVNTQTSGAQRSPSIDASGSGSFVVAWRSFGQDGSHYGVFGRRFDAAGVPQAFEFRANVFITENQTQPSVAVEGDGDFLIAWESVGQDGIFARRFDSGGVPVASDFQVNSYVTGSQINTAASASDDGKIVVAWDSIGQDGDSHGVFAQRFATPSLLDLDGNGSTGALTDGLLLLRFLFGFTGPALTTGSVGDGCTRCSGPALESYIASTTDKRPRPAGGELRVNTHTLYHQFRPDVALDGAGRFIVVWESQYQDGDKDGVFARRFDAAGAAQGDEFRINASLVDAQTAPSIASHPGGFVVAWTKGDYPQDVWFRRFDSNGVGQGADFQANTQLAGAQRDPLVVTDGVGNFVIAWSSSPQDGSLIGVFGQRFDASGVRRGIEFQINAATSGIQSLESLAGTADGRFVATWRANDADMDGVFGRRFDTAGAPQGLPDFLVNSSVAKRQYRSRAAMDGDGGFVVVWLSDRQNESGEDVLGQRFDSIGTKVGGEFLVNVHTLGQRRKPEVTRNSEGAFVVVWLDIRDGSYDAVARTFDAAGAAEGGEFRLNEFPLDGGSYLQSSLESDRDFVVVWTRFVGIPSNHDVFVRRFSHLAAVDIDGNGTTEPLTDGLLVLRYLFGFSGTALTSGAVGPGCTRCTPAAVLAYLQTLD